MGLVNGHEARRQRRGRLQRRVACGLLAAALLAPIPALAQSNTAAGNSQAVLLDPGSIAKTVDLDFGRIVQPLAAGTVVLTPSSSASCSTTGGLVRSGPCRAAEFAILGRRNWKVRVRETNSGVITLTGPGGATMTMTDISFASVSLTATGGANGWNLGRYDITSVDGLATFWLGGTLHVGASQTPGVYNGTLQVQIQFN